jgi:hypothetical protein
MAKKWNRSMGVVGHVEDISLVGLIIGQDFATFRQGGLPPPAFPP